MAIPSPPSTLGSSSLPAYTRRPGLEILFSPVMILWFLSSPYFRVMWMVLNGPSSRMSYFLIYPSSRRICAIASFILDEGTSTVSCFAVLALRILVSISAIGSLIVIRIASLFFLYQNSAFPIRTADAHTLRRSAFFQAADAFLRAALTSLPS